MAKLFKNDKTEYCECPQCSEDSIGGCVNKAVYKIDGGYLCETCADHETEDDENGDSVVEENLRAMMPSFFTEADHA
jgi:hypothetical protein